VRRASGGSGQASKVKRVAGRLVSIDLPPFTRSLFCVLRICAEGLAQAPLRLKMIQKEKKPTSAATRRAAPTADNHCIPVDFKIPAA
jgi:hypothetical protein